MDIKKNPKKVDRILIRSTDLIHFFQYLGMDRVDRSGNTSLQLIALRFNVRSTNADTPEAIQVIYKLVIVVIQVYQVQFLISTIISSKKYYIPEYFYLNDKF